MAAKNRRMFELRLGKLGIVLFVSGMSLLLISMFFLGVFIGKDMEAYPEKFSPGVAEMIRDRLLALAPQTGKPVSSLELEKQDSPAGGEEDFSLTFYKTLGGKKSGPAPDSHGEAKSGAPVAAAPLPAKAEKSPMSGPGTGSAAAEAPNAKPAGSSAVEAGEPALAPEKKAVAGAGPAPPEAPAATALTHGNGIPGKGRFEIQVAAYQDSRKAEKTMGRLKPLGFSPRVVMKEVPGRGKWYRVVIGGFENREKAKTAADLISGKVQGVKCVIRASE